MRDIVPIGQLGRTPEHGRIRLGVKTERAMKSIDTFRFTSPDEQAIREIATLYGGKASPWDEPRARQRNQWQVITETNEIRIFLPPGSLSCWYELWSGGGCQRRCDGVTCEIAGRNDMESVPCLCRKNDAMECRPYTRLNVVLPEIRFGGAWRLETKGWNAAHELPAMEGMIEQLQAVGIVEARLALERRNEVKHGKKKDFVVPKLLVDTSPMAIIEGRAAVGALAPGAGLQQQALPAGEVVTRPPAEADWFDNDDEIVEGEIVEGEVPAPGQRAEDPHMRLRLQIDELKDALVVRGVLDADVDLASAMVLRLTSGRTAVLNETTTEEREKLEATVPKVLGNAALEDWLVKDVLDGG